MVVSILFKSGPDKKKCQVADLVRMGSLGRPGVVTLYFCLTTNAYEWGHACIIGTQPFYMTCMCCNHLSKLLNLCLMLVKKMLPWIYANETAIKIIIIHLRFFKRDNFNFGDYKTHSSMLIIT